MAGLEPDGIWLGQQPLDLGAGRGPAGAASIRHEPAQTATRVISTLTMDIRHERNGRTIRDEPHACLKALATGL